MKNIKFEKSVWPYDPDYAKTCDCRELKIRGGKVYLQANDPHFSFTVSCRANSDRSYTGCFFNHAEITTAEQAMERLFEMNQQGKFD
jgi:hypothetical protein